MRKLNLGVLLMTALLMAMPRMGFAADALPAAADPALEARMLGLANELRCLVCQNETLAASQASLAVDLKNQIRDKMRAGESDEAITSYLVARYGDFVLYRPPFKATTLLLWVGPFGLLVVAIGVLVFFVRRRRLETERPLDENQQARARQILKDSEQQQ